MKRLIVSLALFGSLLCSVLSVTHAQAANRYVRQGAAGNGSGSDWTNAYATLPAALTRGDTYYVADGSYGTYLFDDVESGTSLITIKKATVADHGTSTGWQNTYGDGQATFVDMRFARDYYVVNGQTRDESDWADGAAYGFRATEVFSWPLNFPPGGDHLTFKYMNVGGAEGSSFNGADPSEGFYFVGNGSPVVSDITISRSYVHNISGAGSVIRWETTDQMTIEYSWLGPSWDKEVIRGSGRITNTIIRYNVLKNGCQDDPNDPTSNGCTADIAIWDGNNYNVGAIYGNVIWDTINIPHSDGCILAGGDGGGLVGTPANNWTIGNNTMVGVQGANCSIRFGPAGTSGNVVANNLYYGVGGGTSTACLANTCQSNSVVSSNPFVNSSGGNFHLAFATAAGTTLAAPYNVDADGCTRRADGLWDRGAFEFGGISCGVPPTPPAPPTNLHIVP